MMKNMVKRIGVVLCCCLVTIFLSMFSTAQATTSTQLNKTKIQLQKNEVFTLKVKGNNKNVVWKSSNPSVIKVSNNGKVTAIKNGSAKITAKIKGKNKLICYAKCVKNITLLNKKKITLHKNESFKLKVYGTMKKLDWKSSNPTVIKVTKNGRVTALKNGSAKITAKIGNGKKLICKVNCEKVSYIENPKLSNNELTFGIGDGAKLRVLNTAYTVKWSSEDSSIATVTKDGLVTGISEGTTYIVATVNGEKLKCKIIVDKDIVNVLD